MNFKNLLNFLSSLSENNNREWFNDHKNQFLELKDEFEKFIQELIPKIRKIDPTIGPVEANDCIFRIYRDVRFSKSKEPYKTHFGAYIASGGRKSKTCGYYLHIDPKEAFVAAGAYSPEPQTLKEIRYEIMDHTEDFKKIIENKDFKKLYGELSGEKLKTAPKGFPKDFKDLELVKFKSYEVFHLINEKIILSDNFENYLLDAVKTAVPYNLFFNRLIEHMLNEQGA
jgi:uncharacterized protein (TIGR02453 family)